MLVVNLSRKLCDSVPGVSIQCRWTFGFIHTFLLAAAWYTLLR